MRIETFSQIFMYQQLLVFELQSFFRVIFFIIFGIHILPDFDVFDYMNYDGGAVINCIRATQRTNSRKRTAVVLWL